MAEKTKPAAHPRKLQIVEAALACFLEAGYHQTGVRDIARRAGISLGNLYNHFSGKEAVLAEIARIEADELRPFCTTLTDGRDPGATLERFVTDYAAYASRPENAVLGLEILSEAIRAPQIAALFSDNRAALVTALGDLLAQGAENGQFRSFDTPTETARLILDVIEGRALRTLLEDEPQAGQDALWCFIDAAVRG
ncbi:TetR/AcrR family transcriptional regulator [uncultured Nitratireductor sp.]|uniref:TetR/AcrR family transcriptional regulator n=1 Tax=uncultured Nitratireductor sp. TaxID=520953 RepID=UPI0025E0F4C6|nr:TetR/AcrR family transcriptional regulator [uncultured Nitratireductor sp.]